MPLMLKSQRDGKTLRPEWYGVYTEAGGKRKVVNLNVPWDGTPPASGRVGDKGNKAFERSRAKAKEELARFVDEARRKGKAEHLTERLIESKTGRAVEYEKIAALPGLWRAKARERTAAPRYLQVCDSHFRRFTEFIATRKAVYLYEVTRKDAEEFAGRCRKELAPGTARDCIQLVSSAFNAYLPVGTSNPFKKLAGKGGHGVIHRRPFTEDELRRLIDAARADEFLYPLVVCAAMTGMRRGDVCTLKWSAVDLSAGMVCVKTSKTGETLQIPIFPLLRSVLVEAGGDGKGYVWPAAARMLQETPDGLTWRFKKALVAALGDDSGPGVDIVPAADIAAEAMQAILEHTTEGERRSRIADIFKRYAAGETVRQIEKAVGCARSTVSADLNAVQNWTGITFMRTAGERPDIKEAMARLTTVERKQGQRAASVSGWHALRTTWVTMALSAGVELEMVKRVTGHRTVGIVLDNYFQPDREQFRAALKNALPDVLTGNGGSRPKRLLPADELAELVSKVQAGTASDADKKRLRLLAAKV